MKRKPTSVVVAAVIGALVVWWFHFHLNASIEGPRVDGERPTLAKLAENEELVVSTLFSHRTAHGREYRIRREGTQWTVAIFDTTPAWSREDGRTDEPCLRVRRLSAAEVTGLDETLAYCREVREEYSSATKHFRVRYLRDGREVGEEFYLGFALPSQLAWYEQEGMRGDPDYASDYAELAASYGVSLERMDRMLAFEMLEKEPAGDAEAEAEFEVELYTVLEWKAWIDGLHGFDEIRLTEAIRTVEYPTTWSKDGLKFEERWLRDRLVHKAHVTDADEFLSLLAFSPDYGKATHGCLGLFNVWFYRKGECVGRLHYAHGRYWFPLTKESQRAVTAWLDAHGFPAGALIQTEKR